MCIARCNHCIFILFFETKGKSPRQCITKTRKDTLRPSSASHRHMRVTKATQTPANTDNYHPNQGQPQNHHHQKSHGHTLKVTNCTYECEVINQQLSHALRDTMLPMTPSTLIQSILHIFSQISMGVVHLPSGRREKHFAGS